MESESAPGLLYRERTWITFGTVNSSQPAQPSASQTSRSELGKRGEELAAAYLQQVGYRIVAANFVIPVGRNRVGTLISVEIDLVAYERETLCFVEVKSRMSDWFAQPQVNVDRRKRRQIARAARAYRRMFGLVSALYRYDVITVVSADEEDSVGGPEIQLLRNYWTDDKLRKRTWSERYYD